MHLQTGVQTILVLNCEIIFALVQKTEKFHYFKIGPKKRQRPKFKPKLKSFITFG